MLPPEDHQSCGHLVLMNFDRSLEIHKDTKNEKKEMDNYMKEHKEKMKQHEKIKDYIVSIKKYINQLKEQEITVDAVGIYSCEYDNVRLQRIGASKTSENELTYLIYIYSGDHHATYNPIEDSRIGKPEGLNIRQVVVTNAKAIAAKHEKMKERNQLAASRKIRKQRVAKATSSKTLKNVLPASKEGIEQLLEKATSSYTLNDVLPASRERLEKLLAEAMSSLKNILPASRERLEKLLAEAMSSLKNILPASRERFEKLLAEAMSSLKNILPVSRERREQARDGREQLVAKAASSNTLKEILFASSDGRKQLVAKATSSNTLKEILFASSDGRKQLVAKATSSNTLKEIVIHQADVDLDSQDEYLNKSSAHMLKNVSAGERSKQESTLVKLYRNVMQNETCRMVTGIDMVVTEAKRLLGNERTQIFLDLLDDGLFYFGLSGAAPGFIPNMTQSTVRQHVISFFEHSCDTINRLMTLLLGCPDSKILQQMPEQHFISLMRSVIDFSLKTKTKGGKIISLKESTLIMVDSDKFERAQGEDIPEDVSDRLKRGEKMFAYRFVERRLEKTQASVRRENRPIHSIYFPSDCRLFIYIPTENGSYWHQADMKRERVLSTNKINKYSNVSSR